MKYAIDETELARLERLKEDSDNNRKVYGGDTIATVWYQREAANAVPALVAEVRRLRRNYECSEKSLQRHEHMVAELMEKVEAWEWWDEVRTYDPWSEHPYCTACGNRSKRGKIFDCAVDEYEKIKSTAREAVHADRE